MAESAQHEVRATLDRIAAALRNKDVDAAMAHYAPEVIAFDLLPPLQYRGAAMIRDLLSAWLSSFEGAIAFEMRDLAVAAAADIAFGHCLNRVSGRTKDGHDIDMWWRATTCFRRIAGRWLVAHGHSSEPFDMKTGKALVGLRP